MENPQSPLLSVGDFVAITNQVLEQAYPSILIEGEVDGFKVSQGKFIFFQLKDREASVGCFMMAFALRTPIEDGMKVIVRARPKLTTKGKFSLTVDSVRPSGEGSLKKSFELLKAKLSKEGLLDDARKRSLPRWPRRVAVIASRESAGYADFMKITSERLGGVTFEVYHTSVQGDTAPEQMIRAIEKANQATNPAEVLVMIRGGGSAEDLAAFNDETLVRQIATSRIPTLVGVGHEIDTTLADLVADVRAATPTNAATILLPDKNEYVLQITNMKQAAGVRIRQVLQARELHVAGQLARMRELAAQRADERLAKVKNLRQVIASYDPKRVLERGYVLLRGSPKVGEIITIEAATYNITAEVKTHESK